MDYLKAIVLALVEGITEFLPISSTGHLILVEDFIQLGQDPAFADAFLVIIQLPAILSVLVYFWQDLWPWHKNSKHAPAQTLRLWMRVAIAFIPAAVFGLLFDDILEAWLFHSFPVACALILGGIILILIERRDHSQGIESVHDLSIKHALGIGFFQCLALFPGTSRSAATIIGGLLLGANRAVAAEFSFFLAIPTMIAATSYTLMKRGLDFTNEQWILLGLGSAVSFIVAYASIAFLMNFIKRHSFTAFGVYRIFLGGLVLLYLVMTHNSSAASS